MSVLCVKVFISKTIQTLDYYKCASCTWYIYLSRTASLGTIIASVRDCCVCYDYKSLNNVLNYRRKRLTALITNALSDINGQQSGYRKSKCITGRSPNNELLNSPYSFCIITLIQLKKTVDLIPRKRTSLLYHMYGTIERLTQASTYQYNNFLLWMNFRKLI